MTKFHVLISVKNHVNLLAYSDWAMRCIALLWRDILRPFMCWFSHVDRRWGHMSLSLLGHIMLLGAHGIVGVWVGEGLEELFFYGFPCIRCIGILEFV